MLLITHIIFGSSTLALLVARLLGYRTKPLTHTYFITTIATSVSGTFLLFNDLSLRSCVSLLLFIVLVTLEQMATRYNWLPVKS